LGEQGVPAVEAVKLRAAREIPAVNANELAYHERLL